VAGPAFVSGHAAEADGVGTISVTVNGTTAGNMLVVYGAHGLTTVPGDGSVSAAGVTFTATRSQAGTGSDSSAKMWVAYNLPGGNVTVSFAPSTSDTVLIAAEYSNAPSSASADGGNSQDHTAGATAWTTGAAGFTTTNANDVVVGGFSQDVLGVTFTQSGSWAVRANSAASPSMIGVLVDQTVSATGTYNPAVTVNTAEPWCGVGIAVTAPPAAGYVQNSYRFRNDDGSESAASWVAAEGAAVTLPLNTNVRLRAQVDTTGTPSASQYQLEYKKSGGSYAKALAAQPTPTMPAATQLTAGSSTSNTTSYATASVTLTAGRTYVLGVVHSGTAPLADPTGVQTTGGAVTFTKLDGIGFDTAASSAHKLSVWKVQAGSTVTATVTITTGTATGCAWSLMECDTNAAGTFGTPAKQAFDTSTTATATPGTLTNTAGLQLAFGASALNSTSDTAGGTSWASVGTGNTYATPSTALETAQNTGGTATQVTFSGAGSGNRAAVAFEVKAVVPASVPILLAASANIAASAATATTAQLTAPSGKTTSNFTAASISDDTNPLPGVTVAAGNYTEAEWCLQAVSPAVNGDVYLFQVTRAGTALDTYSVTPQWTVGTAAPLSEPDQPFFYVDQPAGYLAWRPPQQPAAYAEEVPTAAPAFALEEPAAPDFTAYFVRQPAPAPAEYGYAEDQVPSPQLWADEDSYLLPDAFRGATNPYPGQAPFWPWPAGQWHEEVRVPSPQLWADEDAYPPPTLVLPPYAAGGLTSLYVGPAEEMPTAPFTEDVEAWPWWLTVPPPGPTLPWPGAGYGHLEETAAPNQTYLEYEAAAPPAGPTPTAPYPQPQTGLPPGLDEWRAAYPQLWADEDAYPTGTCPGPGWAPPPYAPRGPGAGPAGANSPWWQDEYPTPPGTFLLELEQLPPGAWWITVWAVDAYAAGLGVRPPQQEEKAFPPFGLTEDVAPVNWSAPRAEWQAEWWQDDEAAQFYYPLLEDYAPALPGALPVPAWAWAAPVLAYEEAGSGLYLPGGLAQGEEAPRWEAPAPYWNRHVTAYEEPWALYVPPPAGHGGVATLRDVYAPAKGLVGVRGTPGLGGQTGGGSLKGHVGK
jgi:hypothetical protein